jgi:TPP-dependent pyruvate/acetoin dehydrogenase alpha subunit
VFFCENNGYAITTAVAASHGQPDIAKRGEGYGVPGVIVDGQDVDAVYEVTHAAVERARNGDGPTLVEAKTYRFDEHQVGLKVSGRPYRPVSEVQHYVNHRDPLVLFKGIMLKQGVSEAVLEAIEEEVSHEVSRAIEFAEQSPLPDPADVFDDMYANPIGYPVRTGGVRV